ncbi:Fur family transcriptional regulator [Clostridium paraputrificum]|uniref:Fur family transcriptional regulator n=1 Tax=Clostridium TaxID=1485 RepID=UPI003D33364B
MDTITTIFREKKLKLTPQRLAVYKYLMTTKEHPSAELIYKAIQPEYPTMSLATVYKALKTLVEVGLVQEINVGEGNFRYDGSTTTHPHIQCVNCSKVEDLESFSLDHLNSEVSKHTNFKVLSNKVYFYGICADCNK